MFFFFCYGCLLANRLLQPVCISWVVLPMPSWHFLCFGSDGVFLVLRRNLRNEFGNDGLYSLYAFNIIQAGGCDVQWT